MRLWDLESGECLRVLFETDMEAVTSAVLADDGRHAVSASAGRLMAWDLRRAVRVGTTESPTGGLACLAWSDDGQRVVGGRLEWRPGPVAVGLERAGTGATREPGMLPVETGAGSSWTGPARCGRRRDGPRVEPCAASPWPMRCP